MEQIHKIICKLEALTALVQQIRQYQQKSLLNVQEAATYLSISKSTLYKHTSGGHITYYKPSGKLILFKVDDLDRWINAKKVPSNKELDVIVTNQGNLITSPSNLRK